MQKSKRIRAVSGAVADKPAGKPSLKEKLEVFKEKAAGGEKTAPTKAKGKEEII